MKTPSITIRYGASHNDITVDGTSFNRNALTKSEFGFLCRTVYGALSAVWGSPKGNPKARPRKRRRGGQANAV